MFGRNEIVHRLDNSGKIKLIILKRIKNNLFKPKTEIRKAKADVLKETNK